jgi:salicylate hydroxylase
MSDIGATRSVVIAGAGMGGLTAALALAHAGWTVTLVEKRTALAEYGAGLQLSPNASRILIELGLKSALLRHVFAPERLTVSRWGSETPLHAGDLAEAEHRFGAPYWVIGRRDLQAVLLDAVRGTDRIALKIGRELVAATQDETGVTVTLATESGRSETLHAAVLVGADGLWSKTRHLTGQRRPPTPTGYTAWRALTPPPAGPKAVRLWLGPERHAVHYPIEAGARGNLVVITRDPALHQGWDAQMAPPPALSSRAAPALRAIIASAESWGVWTLHDAEPARMAQGRVALLGDAAHPVLPFMAQGAALAIEDAAVLARLLGAADATGLAAALGTYDRLRRPRAARIRETAQRNGRTYHLPGPLGWARDQVIRRLDPGGLLTRYDWIYGWRDNL